MSSSAKETSNDVSDDGESWIFPLPGPIEIREVDVGGGRGVFAKEDIKPGTVILLEEPFLSIPEDEYDEFDLGGNADDDDDDVDDSNKNNDDGDKNKEGKEGNANGDGDAGKKNEESDKDDKRGSNDDADDDGDFFLLHALITQHICKLYRTVSVEEWKRIDKNLSRLHPKSLDDLPEDVLKCSRDACESDAKKVHDAIFGDDKSKNDDGDNDDDKNNNNNNTRPELTVDDVLLILLRMRFNAFASGIYLFSSMVNHKCRPNAKKFGHVDTQVDPETGIAHAWTEFVATEHIPAGTEIVISYIDPLERSYEGRVRAFSEQHFANPGAPCFPEEFEKMPEWDNPIAQRITREIIIDARRAAKEEELKRRQQKEGVAGPAAPGDTTPEGIISVEESDVAEARIALEEEIDTIGDEADLTILAEMKRRSVALYGVKHLVTQRVRSLIVPACLHAMDKAGSGPGSVKPAITLLKAAVPLLEAQEIYLGRDHCDVATTMQDMHMAIEHLLGTTGGGPALFEAFPERYGTFGRASSASFRLKKRSAEIQKMYDVNN